MGIRETLFGGQEEVKFEEIPQSAGAIEARKRLLEISRGAPPEVPLREIAPPGPLGPERTLARQTATELAQPVDIFSLPEVQGTIQETLRQGNLLANRLGRGLQATGAFTSTPGRDILGRAVTDVQKSLAASLGQFAESERARRRSLIPELERLGLTEELRAQGFSQAELDALFQKETIESQQLQTFTIPLLQSIIGQQPGQTSFIQEPFPGLIEQIGLIASLFPKK